MVECLKYLTLTNKTQLDLSVSISHTADISYSSPKGVNLNQYLTAMVKKNENNCKYLLTQMNG